MLSVTFYLIVAVLLALCCYSCAKPKKFPPGPKWLPVVGCIPEFYQLKKKHGYAHRAFEVLAQKYGPILGLKFGKQKLVVFSSCELIKKALLTEEFNGRPTGFFFRVRSFGKRKGVLFTDGNLWSQHRRFTLRQMKVFGLGQELMAQRLAGEAQQLVDFIARQSVNGPVPMHRTFDIAILNSLWTIFAGHRFEYDDGKLHEILHIVHEVFRLSDTMGGTLSHLPFLRYIVPEMSGYNDLIKALNRFWTFLGDEIAEHEAQLPVDQPRDLIDAFLMEIRERGEQPTDQESIFDRENLLILCLDLFLAGMKTTTDSLSQMFAFSVLNPKWIKALQNELDKVVGRDRKPTISDAAKLPLVEAFLAEAQRTLVLAPLGVPHRAIKDVPFEGYIIPKDTIILVNYNTAHKDKACWDDPEDFRPERFFDSEGNFKQVNPSMPFGLGKRRCLGEGLARPSLFVYFTYILHHFELDVARGYPKPDLEGYDGFLVSPKPYYLDFTPRADVF